MALFGLGAGNRKKRAEAIKSDNPTDAVLQEQLSELSANGDRAKVDRAVHEAQAAVDEATRADLRMIKILEQGRCPNCQSRTEQFLYTRVCSACGWNHRSPAAATDCTVYLDTGDNIACEHVFRTSEGDLLLVRDGMVVAEVMRTHVRRVDYHLAPEERESERESVRKLRGGFCSWCEKDLAEAEENGPYEEYVAFGALQERYLFCSHRCLKEFRQQFPSRIHRNCYETDCKSCNLCIKRYDVDGFKRTFLL